MKKVFLCLLIMTSCKTMAPFSYTNDVYKEKKKDAATAADSTIDKGIEDPGIATFQIPLKKGKDRLVLLALSGGGSRAAYFSAKVMQQLDSLGILEQVDLISSVSGGSMTAAYYCFSADEKPEDTISGRTWKDKKNNDLEIKKLLRKNYIARWLGSWLLPNNVFKYWFTGYTRTDIMAQTLADNLYDRRYFAKRPYFDLRFSECNNERPRLVINATLATNGQNGEPFTFTYEDFRYKLNSDIKSYHVSRAVMASATFPGAFQYNVMKNYYSEDTDSSDTTKEKKEKKKARYVHLYDGGIHDNLGFDSVIRVLFGYYEFTSFEFGNDKNVKTDAADDGNEKKYSISVLSDAIANDINEFIRKNDRRNVKGELKDIEKIYVYSPHRTIRWLNELLTKPKFIGVVYFSDNYKEKVKQLILHEIETRELLIIKNAMQRNIVSCKENYLCIRDLEKLFSATFNNTGDDEKNKIVEKAINTYSLLRFESLDNLEKLYIKKINRMLLEKLHRDICPPASIGGSIAPYKEIYVISIDAYNDLSTGIEPTYCDPRGFKGRLLDSTLFDGFSLQLKDQRNVSLQGMIRLESLISDLRGIYNGRKYFKFIHVTFEDLKRIYMSKYFYDEEFKGKPLTDLINDVHKVIKMEHKNKRIYKEKDVELFSIQKSKKLFLSPKEKEDLEKFYKTHNSTTSGAGDYVLTDDERIIFNKINIGKEQYKLQVLYENINAIPTSLHITDKNMTYVDDCVKKLFEYYKDNDNDYFKRLKEKENKTVMER